MFYVHRLVSRTLHHLIKFLKQVPAIMRTRGAFGVVLDAEGGEGFVFDPGDGVVVKVDVGDFNIRRERFFCQCETVILRGDFDLASLVVADGLIGAAVAEFEFLDFAAECQA